MVEKIKGVIGGLVLIAFGIAMILNPDLMDGAEASGRRTLIKSILIFIWSLPAGIIVTILGGFIIYGAASAEEEEEQGE